MTWDTLAIGDFCRTGSGGGFLHEVADQPIGIEPDHGRNRLAASRSTGTGGRWLWSRPLPKPSLQRWIGSSRIRPGSRACMGRCDDCW